MKYILATAVAFFTSNAADARAPLPEPQITSTRAGPCELHVWPATGLNSVYHGWFHGGIVNGAVTAREGYPVVPADPVDTLAQVTLLTGAKPQHMLNRDGDTLVVHAEALSSRAIRSATTRLDVSTAPCYAELIVDDVFLQQDVVSGSFLKTLFRYREFGAAPQPQRVFGTWVKTPLKLFPPKSPDSLPASQAEFKSAFVHNVELFGIALMTPPRNNKKRS